MTASRTVLLTVVVTLTGFAAPAAHAAVAPMPEQPKLSATEEAKSFTTMVLALEQLAKSTAKLAAADLDDRAQDAADADESLKDLVSDRADAREDAAEEFFEDRGENAAEGETGFDTVQDAEETAAQDAFDAATDALDAKLELDKEAAEAFAEQLANPNNEVARQALVAYCNEQMGNKPAAKADPKKPTRQKDETKKAYDRRLKAWKQAKDDADGKQARQKEWVSDRAGCLDGAQADTADEWLDDVMEMLDNNHEDAVEQSDRARDAALAAADRKHDTAQRAFERRQAKDRRETAVFLKGLLKTEVKYAAALDKRADRAINKLAD